MDAVSTYRAAVVGCGAIGSFIADDIEGASIRMGLPYGHAPVYVDCPRTELVAASDIDEERRARFAQRWHLKPEQLFEDYREMLRRKRIDVVSVASPTPFHAEMAEAAIASGVRAIFLEKPVASDLESAYQLKATSEKSAIPISVNHTRRGDQLYQRARQLIDTGVIGSLHSMIAQFSGGLMWNGTHAFDMLNYLNGDTPAVFIQGQLDDPAGMDPGGSAYLLYENGVRAFVNGTSGNPVLFRIEAMGSEGRIVIGNYDLELWRKRSDISLSELALHPFPQVLPSVSPMMFLLNELLDATGSGSPITSNIDSAISALELIVGLHRSSALDGARIALPNEDRSLKIASL